MDPDELLVWMILANLPVGRRLAEQKRQEARPQLHAVSVKRITPRSSPAGGKPPGTSAAS
jgi:hypothetical protein